jgi:hypothetical protein
MVMAELTRLPVLLVFNPNLLSQYASYSKGMKDEG